MSVISGQDYYDISVSVASSVDAMKASPPYLWDAVYTIVLLQVIVPELDLLRPFYDAYQANTIVAFSDINYLAAVRALQIHVLTNSTSSTVSDYIRANIHNPLGYLIPQEFADLSSRAGYSIDSDLVG